MKEHDNRISIRVNGKDKPAKPERLEKETAAAGEKDFQWLLPEDKPAFTEAGLKQWKDQHERRKKQRPIAGYAPKLPFQRKKKVRRTGIRKRKSAGSLLKKQWMSGFSAIVVGLVMGIIVLTMFTEEEAKQASAEPKPEQATETPDNGESAKTEVFTDLGLTLQMVQGAVFSSTANGKNAVNDLRDGGLAAVLNEKENKVYMFIGVGTAEDSAEALGLLYKQQGQDVWVKTYQVGTGSSRLDQETGAFLKAAKPVMQSMITGSVRGLTTGQSVFTDSQWKTLEKEIGQLKGKATEDTSSLMEDLESAMADFKDSRGNAAPSSLWNAQQALLEAVLAYQEILN